MAAGVGVLVELDVSLVSPRGVPGVLDNGVGDTILNSVTDGEDTVVELVSASVGQDTSRVELEGGLVSLDGNGGGSGLEGLLEALLGSVDVDLALVLVSSTSAGSLVVARAILSSVWVVVLSHEIELLGVGQGLVHDTTLATLGVVASSDSVVAAVNELLLREGGEDSGLLEVSSLERSSGGEGPARSALTLVLDSSDGALVSPVNGVGSGEVLVGLVNGGLGLELSLVSEQLSVLLNGPVAHVIVGNLVLSKLVEGNDELVVSLELLVSGEVLLLGGVSSVVSGDELDELVFVLSHGGGSDGGGKGNSREGSHVSF